VFTLKAHSVYVIEFLKFTFFDTQHAKFERNLSRFSKIRHALYRDFPDVLRARDNISGEIGEYFAIKALNQSERNSVIRLSSGLKDIDAIQIRNGATYAIKTIGKIPQTTSNIWAKDPAGTVDYFVITCARPRGLEAHLCSKDKFTQRSELLKATRDQGNGHCQLPIAAVVGRK
jgi:hypothetical protein